jgi:hypothetical protein
MHVKLRHLATCKIPNQFDAMQKFCNSEYQPAICLVGNYHVNKRLTLTEVVVDLGSWGQESISQLLVRLRLGRKNMQEERINQQGYLATNNHNGTTEIEQGHFSNSVAQQPQVPPQCGSLT